MQRVTLTVEGTLLAEPHALDKLWKDCCYYPPLPQFTENHLELLNGRALSRGLAASWKQK